jgi:hypothetical protein
MKMMQRWFRKTAVQNRRKHEWISIFFAIKKLLLPLTLIRPTAEPHLFGGARVVSRCGSDSGSGPYLQCFGAA